MTPDGPITGTTQHTVRPGLITHTELASTDPTATRAWCAEVLGWTFGTPVPTPTGDYHMWDFGNRTGGGIRAMNPPEPAGTTPYVEVEDVRKALSKAEGAGAKTLVPPMEVPGGVIAVVQAPGGPMVGFWAPR